MQPDFWRACWKDGRTGFHRSEPNPLLTQNIGRLGLEPGGRVLVPFCGMTVDMLWLAGEGFEVLGVELTEKACRAFVEQSGMAFSEDRHGPFLRLQAPGLTLLCGDFFGLTAELMGRVDAVWDRAAFIALPDELRSRYARHVAGLCRPGTGLLMATIEYPQVERNGPPFSLTQEEVMQRYGIWSPMLLQREDKLAEQERWELTALAQDLWLGRRGGVS